MEKIALKTNYDTLIYGKRRESMNRTALFIAIMSLLVLVALGMVSVAAHTEDETTSEHDCWNWDEQDMRSHHGWMHGDDFDEHHGEMHGTSWEESSAHCH